jgi:hypothetical protein
MEVIKVERSSGEKTDDSLSSKGYVDCYSKDEMESLLTVQDELSEELNQ